MSENSESKINDTINAVTGLAKEIPIYQDGLQPATKEVGKSLETVAKTINVALAPVSALVWGYDKIKDFVDQKVSSKLKHLPEEKIVTPPPNIAGPTLESLKYTGSIEELKELYANLLASSMNQDTTKNAHPCFVEIIKQLTADEAKLLKAFISRQTHPMINVRNNREDNSGGRDEIKFFTKLGEKQNLDFPKKCPEYLENLNRLALIVLKENYELVEATLYKDLEEDKYINDVRKFIDAQEGRKSALTKGSIELTNLGSLFMRTCVHEQGETL